MSTTIARDRAGLETRFEGGVVHLTLSRPEKRNALSQELLDCLDEVLSEIAAEASARVVVIGAKGPVFCAGHDLVEMTGRSEDEYRALFATCSKVMLGLRRLPQPVIARVQGVATAAGCQLVAACDLAVAASTATFATPGVKIGLFCTTPMVPLVRAVPDKAAMEMLLTGIPISAERAAQLGLVNRVVPADQLDAAVRELTDAMMANSPLAIRLGKRAFHDLRDLSEESAYEHAIEIMTANALRHDAQEGISAFLEKRRAQWTGDWRGIGPQPETTTKESPMPLIGFDQLHEQADSRTRPVSVAVAGGHERTVLEALRVATDRGWVAPIVIGPAREIEETAGVHAIGLDGFTLVEAAGDEHASAAVWHVRHGLARMLMKGRIATPALMHAVLDPETGLQSDRVVCQVVLMEILRDQRRFLLADTGISVRPKLSTRIDILKSTVEVAHALGAERPNVALMAASESVNSAMPETLEAAELQNRNETGEFPDCIIQGPLSFDLAYAVEAGARKRIAGQVVGAADAMIFPDLLSANLTVKAIMYTADCRFGGVLRGASVPVVFMSRADSTETRLDSLALALVLLDENDRS